MTVIPLERLGHILPLGEITNLCRLEVLDVDPEENPGAKSTDLAAMVPDHHLTITSQETEPLLGRPVYFVRRFGNIELWPRCDKAYWFRATFRDPIKRRPAPKAED